MALTKQKKGEILDSLKKIVADAKTLVFVNFHGLKMPDTSKLRRTLRQAGIGFRVSKKTLIRKAFEGMPIEGELPELSGEVAFSYGADLLAPAREVKALPILGGVFEGRFIDAPKMIELANIPEMKVLYGKLLFLIQSPLKRLAIALSEVAKQK